MTPYLLESSQKIRKASFLRSSSSFSVAWSWPRCQLPSELLLLVPLGRQGLPTSKSRMGPLCLFIEMIQVVDSTVHVNASVPSIWKWKIVMRRKLMLLCHFQGLMEDRSSTRVRIALYLFSYFLYFLLTLK